METSARKTTLLIWPFALLWRLATRIERALGIVKSILLGLFLMLIGYVLCVSLVGILLGLPLFCAGLFLVLRGLY